MKWIDEIVEMNIGRSTFEEHFTGHYCYQCDYFESDPVDEDSEYQIYADSQLTA